MGFCYFHNTSYLVFVNNNTFSLVFMVVLSMLSKNRMFCGLGSSIEWFDFALYGFFGPLFSKLFFSHAHENKWFALTVTYLIFAAGFAARPVGGLIFGYLGDKYGRLVSLRITPLLITFFTTLMAFLPTYQAVGRTAVMLLIVTRIFQGILLGGEFTGNIVYLCESSLRWKYLWGSIGSCTGSFGIILASITVSVFYFLFPYSFMYEYGWRIAFLCSIPLGVITFYVRLKILESPEFKADDSYENPIREGVLYYKKLLILCVGIVYLHATSFYFVFIFLPVFLNKIRHLQESATLLHNTLFLIIHLCFIPLFGFIVNLIGGFKSQIAIGLLFVFLSMPIFYFIAYGTESQVVISLFVFSVMTAINAAIIPGLLSSLIPTKIRYTLFALSFNIGFGIFGGMTPFVGLFLTNTSGKILLPGVYLTIVALVTLIVSYMAMKAGNFYEIRKLPVT